MSKFDEAFIYVVGQEGTFSGDPLDDGNWTGGKQGVGELKGTKFGLSAAQYPHLDIRNLRVEDVQPIFEKDYWQVIRGDDLPDGVSTAVFDCAVNQGPGTAIRLMQTVLRVEVDGILGPKTLAALGRVSKREFIARFQTARVRQYFHHPKFYRYGQGWIERSFQTAMHAIA